MATRIIAHITDTHLGQRLQLEGGMDTNRMIYVEDPAAHRQHLLLMLEDLSRRGIRDIIFGGDIGSVQMNQWFFQTMLERYPGLQLVPGNHDVVAEILKYYHPASVQESDQLNSTREEEYFRYIFLDTSDNRVDQPRLNWLRQVLDTPKQVLLFMHHPLLSIDTPVERLGAALQGREEMTVLLKNTGASITVFCGHYHMTDEAVDGNIRQYASPAASYQIVKQATTLAFDQDTFGYRIIETDHNRFSTEVVWLKKENA